MWIDGTRTCQNGSAAVGVLPVMSCKGMVVRNLLVLECTFNVAIANLV
jgi:hypothetical protein